MTKYEETLLFELVVDDELKSEIIVSTNIDDVEYVGKFVILDA